MFSHFNKFQVKLLVQVLPLKNYPSAQAEHPNREKSLVGRKRLLSATMGWRGPCQTPGPGVWTTQCSSKSCDAKSSKSCGIREEKGKEPCQNTAQEAVLNHLPEDTRMSQLSSDLAAAEVAVHFRNSLNPWESQSL